MAASTALKRVFVRQLQASATAGSISFSAALDAVEASAFSAAKGARLATAVAANGQSHQFSVPDGVTSLGDIGIAELCNELRDRFANASAYLVESGVETPTDSQVTTQMLADLVPPLNVPTDFSGMIR